VPSLLAQLPAPAARAITDLLQHVGRLEQHIINYERELVRMGRSDDRAERVQALYGVGPLSASAIIASVGNAHEFANGRSSPPGSAWCRGNIPPAVRPDSATSLDAVTTICAPC
jgi:transposase